MTAACASGFGEGVAVTRLTFPEVGTRECPDASRERETPRRLDYGFPRQSVDELFETGN